MNTSLDQLNYLANLYGVNTSYLDMNNRLRPTSVESLLAILKVLGSPVSGMKDIPAAIREKQQIFWQEALEPVTVLRNSDILTLNVHLPANEVKGTISGSLTMETGELKYYYWHSDSSSIVDTCEMEGTHYVTIRLYLPERLPVGYHKLSLELPGRIAETYIISAPLKAYSPPSIKENIWGIFLPLHALHTRHSWGAGDFADLETLMEWVYQTGGNMVGTLPLLASFFDEKSGPSPYMPASRLFWNEFYLNLSWIPELEKCPSAQALISSTAFQNDLSTIRRSHSIDYSQNISIKRKALEEITEYFFTEKPERFERFQCYVNSHPSMDDYARFRAVGEKHGLDWHHWTPAMRNRRLNEGDYAEKDRQYHLFTQWLAQEQIRNLSEKARKDNLYLYLDLPVGVHPFSFDVWREQEAFVSGAAGGAPPDPVFTSGQNWSFPPLHPEGIRKQGYRYIIDILRHQMDLAGMLRIDHMMNFHRLFWIPQGMPNREGVYVNYRAEEFYAILAMESYRHKSIIIGEDLGMVPPEVRPAMGKNGIFRMFVGQYQLIAENQLGEIPSHCVASLNTHDMFPFTSFWQENDIAERLKLKLIDKNEAHKELEQRREVKQTLLNILQYKSVHNAIPQDAEATLRAILNMMANSDAYALLISLEDLWQEIRPQNVPGTERKQNWSRKARYGFEKFSILPQVNDVLCDIDRIRKRI